MDQNIRPREELLADATTGEPVPPQPNQFMLILQDGANGVVEMAGVQRPEAYDAASPCHQIGRFIQNNLDQIVAAVQEEAAMAKRLASNSPVAPQGIILPKG